MGWLILARSVDVETEWVDGWMFADGCRIEVASMPLRGKAAMQPNVLGRSWGCLAWSDVGRLQNVHCTRLYKY